MSETWNALWSRAVDSYAWLKALVLGEFDENRPLSVVVADMLLSCVPGVIVVTSARDLAAVCLRLGERYCHGDGDPSWQEWALLIACALGVFGPLICAAVGSAAALIGGGVGFVVGDEAAAFLRMLCLLLIHNTEITLQGVVAFASRFVKGDIVKLLRPVRFGAMERPLVEYLGKFLQGMRDLLTKVRGKLSVFDQAHTLLDRMATMEQAFYALQERYVQEVPRALAQLDEALQRVLQQSLPIVRHPAYAGIRAVEPTVVEVQKVRISSGIGKAPHVLLQENANAAEPASNASHDPDPERPLPANVHRDWEDVDPLTLTVSKKGIYGELVSDRFMQARGYTSELPLDRQVRSLEDMPRGRGIDGVYKKPEGAPPPPYVVTETKYRTGGNITPGRLSKTKDGKQMGADWIEGRLNDAVGDDKAEEIRDATYEAWLMGVDESGKVVSITKLDKDGNALLDATGKPITVPAN